jgi:signal transduction histidine kinase
LLSRHPAAQTHRLTIHEFGPDAVAEINGTDFLQILLNLTINALQASDTPHRVEVQARRVHDARILEQYGDGLETRFLQSEGFDKNAPLLAVSVTDTGGGIAPDALAKIFREKFTTKRPAQGTGLGLSIVRRLVNEAKAAVHVKTKVGAGSTFTLFIRLRS